MIIAINGLIGSGKDTLGKYLQHHGQDLSDTSMGFPTWEINKFAAKLKQVASLLTGIPVEKFEDQEFKKTFLPTEWDYEPQGEDWVDGKPQKWLMTVRLFLQKLGTEAIRENIHTNAWVNALFAEYKPLNHKWIITDCRFPNEAQAVKDRGGIVIRINRGEQPTEEQRSKLHPSETSLDNWDFDFVVDNNGDLEALEQKAKEILAKITVL